MFSSEPTENFLLMQEPVAGCARAGHQLHSHDGDCGSAWLSPEGLLGQPQKGYAAILAAATTAAATVTDEQHGTHRRRLEL